MPALYASPRQIVVQIADDCSGEKQKRNVRSQSCALMPSTSLSWIIFYYNWYEYRISINISRGAGGGRRRLQGGGGEEATERSPRYIDGARDCHLYRHLPWSCTTGGEVITAPFAARSGLDCPPSSTSLPPLNNSEPAPDPSPTPPPPPPPSSSPSPPPRPPPLRRP